MNYILKAKEIIAASLKVPVTDIADDAKLSSIEQIDSLAFESIVTSMEAFLGSKVDSVKLLEMRSVKDLAAMLQTK